MMARWIGAAIAVAVLIALAMDGGGREGTAESTEVAGTKTAIFAGGCFWCVEDVFDNVPGVTETVSGYAGGTKPNPTYGDHAGYQEAVRVRYDPGKVSFAMLVDVFWRNIDPFNADGQFCDEGEAYRSVIFVSNDEERRVAETTKQAVKNRFKKPVATEIKPVTTFTPAEDYHQDYHNQNPVSYKFYKRNCGRPRRLKEIWGPPSTLGAFGAADGNRAMHCRGPFPNAEAARRALSRLLGLLVGLPLDSAPLAEIVVHLPATRILLVGGSSASACDVG